MRYVALVVPCLLHLSVHAAPAQPSCAVEAKTYDSLDVLCTLPHDASKLRFAFIARFSGGHDDTQASLRARLDGQALQCDDGSKTELFAEDGDVSLQCRFSIDGSSGSDSRLQAAIHWSHAQFTDFRLEDR